jgi:pimeloyl-ACP methyl ester carboxylesterase
MLDAGPFEASAPATPVGEIPVFTSADGAAAVDHAYRRVLDRWPVRHVERDVPTRYGMTHVIDSGPLDGPVVVLLHAYFATATSWYRTVGGIGPEYRTIAVDVIGDANPSRPTRPMASLDDYLGWYLDLVGGLGIGEHRVVGNSFGGFLATHFAMAVPHRISALILIAPAATIHPMPGFYTHMFIPKAAYLFMPWLPGRASMMRTAADWMRAGLPRDPVWDPLFLSVLLHGSTANRVWPRVYAREELRRIRAPILLLLGDRERIYRPEAAAAAARTLLPQSSVQIIPGAHHIAALAQPMAVNAAISRFFADSVAV